MTVTQDNKAAERLVHQITSISTLPNVAMRIVEVVQDPQSGAKELMQVVGSDPALTTRVLRTVNSAAYGLSVRVTNLQNAVSFLGFNSVRNLALTASVSHVFRGGDQIGSYSRVNLWRHMVSVAVAARLVARRLGVAQFEDAFLAGLLHDIGIVLEDQHAGDAFRDVITSLKDGTSLCDVEQSILGFDHAQIGAMVVEKWRFPDLLRQAVAGHHSSHRLTGDAAVFVQAVEVADFLCTTKGITAVGVKEAQPNIGVFNSLGLDALSLKVLASDLDESLARHESLFEML